MAIESPNPNEHNGRGSFVHHTSWKAPLDDSFVLHLGGLISYDNEVCVGSWVLRDHNAMLKAASSLPMPFGPDSDMMKVMLRALLNALTFATDQNLGVDYLEIHASYEPITCLLSGHVTVALGSENLQLYNECVDLLRSMKSLTVHLVPDYDNLAADKLAKKGTQTPETQQQYVDTILPGKSVGF